MSINRWMDKEDVRYTHTHTHNGILLSHKKNEIMPFAATGMDLEIINLSEVSQTEKDKYHWISLMCRILKKKWYKWTYLQNRDRLTYIENQLMAIKRESGGRDKLGIWD